MVVLSKPFTGCYVVDVRLRDAKSFDGPKYKDLNQIKDFFQVMCDV